MPPVAFPPEPKGAYVGQSDEALGEGVRERVAREGARTIPGREHGGNCDIKNLSKYVFIFMRHWTSPCNVNELEIKGLEVLFPGVRERCKSFCGGSAFFAGGCTSLPFTASDYFADFKFK